MSDAAGDEADGDASDDAEITPYETSDLGLTTYREPARKIKRSFAQWHRPRKQFVRKKQWLLEAWQMFEERAPEEELKYLGLPGTDLLDLRVLHNDLCVPQSRGLSFLGFHNAASEGSNESIDLDVSVQELKQLPLVHELSEVVRDDIRKLGSPLTMAFKRAKESGPFDVVNLDLCGSAAEEEPLGIESMYEALNRVAALQALQPKTWLLLITSRFDRDRVSSEAADHLLPLFVKALNCPEVSNSWEAVLAEEVCAGLIDRTLGASDLTDGQFVYAMATGFCMWLFERVQAHSHQRTNLRASFCYHAAPGGKPADMVSLALRFRRVIIASPDPAGLALGDAESVDWCEVAHQVSGRISGMEDLDQVLTADAALRSELIDESALLLEQARYDAAAYREWAADYQS